MELGGDVVVEIEIDVDSEFAQMRQPKRGKI